MDFNDTPSEAEFRAESRDWLASQAPKREPGQAYAVRRGDDALLPLAKEWQAKKFEANFAGINLPKEYGGRGDTRVEQIIFAQEEANFVTPPTVFGISHGMVVPTLLPMRQRNKNNVMFQRRLEVTRSGVSYSLNPPEDRTLRDCAQNPNATVTNGR
jgi:alkylation response protein AidB-like acyl-CoA dehydrogenase